MSVKDQVLEAVQHLPADATWDDVEEKIRFLHAVDQGLRDAQAGRTIPHIQVKQQISQWLS
jgi:predicted transcriptional regulator